MGRSIFDDVQKHVDEQAFYGPIYGNPRETREVILNKLLYEARQTVSKRIEQEAAFDVMPMIRQDLTTHLARMAWPGNRKSETKVITEDPRYPTWKHQLVAELPNHSLRRRFLERFFRINVLERTIVTHTVTADTGYIFPECNLHFPDSLGRISYLTDVQVDSQILDPMP